MPTVTIKNYHIEHNHPSVDEFITLRESIGWGPINKSLAEKSLNNSLFSVIIRKHAELIAMGRVVGDGAMYFYVQDVIVAPGFQRLGLGALVMDNIEAYLSQAAKKGATIGLLSAQGKEDFYARYSYLSRPANGFGAGMCKFV